MSLRLWSTKESPHNFQLQRYNAGQLDQAAENTGLTDVLYPNDNHEVGKRIRLKQEFLLVSASLQDIINQHLGVFENMTQFVWTASGSVYKIELIFKKFIPVSESYGVPIRCVKKLTE